LPALEENTVAAEKPEWLEQMEGTFETLNEGVLITDDCGRVRLVNSVLEEITGYPREALLGEDPGKQLHAPEDLALIDRLRTKARRVSAEELPP
jgi:PAS domain S-box-containing protein